MKDFKYAVMIPIVAFLMGATSKPFGATGILQAVNRVPAFFSAHRGLIGRDERAGVVPQTGSIAGSPAPAVGADGIAGPGDDLSAGRVEEYAREPEGSANQGRGYGDVFDSNGHLLWRFAVIEHDKAQWTILKYFSEPTSKRRNFEPGQTPQTQN
jgi:hypothetical protein